MIDIPLDWFVRCCSPVGTRKMTKYPNSWILKGNEKWHVHSFQIELVDSDFIDKSCFRDYK